MSQSQRFQQPKLVDAGDHGEGESMSAVLLNPLNDLQTIAQALFISLGPSHSKPLPPPPPPSAILACDQAISDALSTAHLHQIKQRRIEALKQEIVEMDATWKDICIELETGKRELEELLKESDERLEAIEKAKTASVPYPELLAYAQRLSAFTAAPPNLTEENLLSQQPGPLFFPPLP
ncbi:hypothetical protein ONZ45_g16697 [Pleurotus djamor]|nr:hypothetical protein ONZ45_g16697 [Pleurotus djamor]